MTLTDEKILSQLDSWLKQASQSGETITINHNGQVFKIVPVQPVNKLDHLISRSDGVNGNPDDLIHMEWNDLWKP